MGKMTIYKKFQIGKYWESFSFEGKNFHEAIMESQNLSFDGVERCGICGSDELKLAAHTTKEEGYSYAYIRCRKCRATLNFGQQKKESDIFYLRTVDAADGTKIYDWKPFQSNQK